MSTQHSGSIRTGLDREKARLYAPDLADAQWLSAPGNGSHGAVEAPLSGGGVAMRNPADPRGLVLRFTAHEWEAFKLGALHGGVRPSPGTRRKQA
ncbi:DUF397 domain-containing protein [Streptomyces sp. KL116D]|uniref:DUF397 domain-containing protein n=1 Tax=Streptomyces sp. KL116D TaxID=3045152 RepID=UPI003557A2EA